MGSRPRVTTREAFRRRLAASLLAHSTSLETIAKRLFLEEQQVLDWAVGISYPKLAQEILVISILDELDLIGIT